VPRLWNETIEAHRQDVRDAIFETTASLVREQGVLSVTMSQIAAETGIGRATLYKYFPDVEAILFAWHERQITGHLRQLQAVRDEPGTPLERLRAVLEAYALITRDARAHHDTELGRLLGRSEHVAQAQRRVQALIRELIHDGAAVGDVRDDIAAGELANFCLHALDAAATLSSKPAVRRLVDVTLAGLVDSG
jgi:AcrR family transcriptional regulator